MIPTTTLDQITLLVDDSQLIVILLILVFSLSLLDFLRRFFEFGKRY